MYIIIIINSVSSRSSNVVEGLNRKTEKSITTV